jgi:glutamate racemase
MIVVACNSASSAGYDVLLEFFRNQALFVNVVDPLVSAVAQRGFQKVGVIATKATVQSGIYHKQLHRISPSLSVESLATPLLAPMIEEGFVHNLASKAILDTYLAHPGFADIEALLLACTHYPLIRPEIEDYFQHRIEVIDSTKVVADEVASKLAQNDLLNLEKRRPHRFFVSDYTQSFEETTRLFYGEAIQLEQYQIW